MDVRSPFVINCGKEEELDKLRHLIVECEQFLGSWNVYQVIQSDEMTDAVVAMFELQRQALEREAYLLDRVKQEKLPF